MDQEDKLQLIAVTVLTALKQIGNRLLPRETLYSEVNVRIGAHLLTFSELDEVVQLLESKRFILSERDGLTNKLKYKATAEGRAWLNEIGG